MNLLQNGAGQELLGRVSHDAHASLEGNTYIVFEVFLNDAIRNRLVRLGRMVTDSRLKALVINLRH